MWVTSPMLSQLSSRQGGWNSVFSRKFEPSSFRKTSNLYFWKTHYPAVVLQWHNFALIYLNFSWHYIIKTITDDKRIARKIFILKSDHDFYCIMKSHTNVYKYCVQFTSVPLMLMLGLWHNFYFILETSYNVWK